MTTERRDDRSLGELFADLASETSTLVRKEVQLAKTELSDKVTEVGRNVGWIGAGGALLHAGLLALVAAAIIGLGRVIPGWLSALVIGIVVLGVGYFLLRRGLDALGRIDPTPRQTVETLKQDQQMIKEQLQ
jgi:xanthine/uracil permease